MSFWDLSDGEAANENVQKDYEVPGGNMDPIPNNSDCLSEIEGAKWADKGEGADKVRFVEIKWRVSKPEDYANRVVFQKLWVDDLDPQAKTREKALEKRDKARRMLATIDANGGGKLMKSNDAPTDDSLSLALVGIKAVIKVMLWEMKDSRDPGNMMRGNWVSAVKPKDAETKTGDAPTPKPQSNGGYSDLDDEIPF